MPSPETRASPSSAGTLLSTVMLLAIIVTTTWLRTGVAHDIVRPLSNVAEIPASPAQTSRFGHRRSSRRTADGAPRRGGRGGARGGVGRARTGRLRERPSRREGGLSAARAARRAALLRRRQPLFRAGAWRRRSSDRASGRCSAHPSRAPRARCCCRRRRPLLAVFPSVCPTLITVAAHGSLPAPTLHVRTVVGICMYAATDDDKNASPAPGHCISVRGRTLRTSPS